VKLAIAISVLALGWAIGGGERWVFTARQHEPTCFEAGISTRNIGIAEQPCSVGHSQMKLWHDLP
jgi:hypothetical protein